MTEMTRRPVILNLTKEQCIRMAEQEGDTIIGAGVPDKIPATLDEALAELERLHRIYIQACTGRSEFRKALRDSRAREAVLAARVKEAREVIAALVDRIDRSGGLGEYKGGHPFALKTARDFLAALSPAASDEGPPLPWGRCP